MACEVEEVAFNRQLTIVQQRLNTEMAAIADDTERRAGQIADEFEADNDVAAGVGAAAGTSVGGVLGGPIGAGVGAAVGRVIGSLFTLEIGTHRQEVIFDVPQTAMRTRAFSYDLPEVTVADQDISFDVPTTRMERRRGPDIPHTTVRWENECVGPRWARVCTKVPKWTTTWEPSWLDLPVFEMRTQRIVIGVPQVVMRTQQISFDVPEVAMRPTSMAIDVPSLTLRFVKDAGRRTAAAAAALAQSAQEAVLQRQLAFQGQLKAEVLPYAVAMFACRRDQLLQFRSAIAAQFEPQIAILTSSLTGLVARGVPEGSQEVMAARGALNVAIAQRDAAVAELDRAIVELDGASRAAIDQFMSGGALSGFLAESAHEKSNEVEGPGLVSWSPPGS